MYDFKRVGGEINKERDIEETGVDIYDATSLVNEIIVPIADYF